MVAPGNSSGLSQWGRGAAPNMETSYDNRTQSASRWDQGSRPRKVALTLRENDQTVRCAVELVTSYRAGGIHSAESTRIFDRARS